MKEISLHALDIAQNSVTAGASNLDLRLEEDGEGVLTLTVIDDGRGMSPELLARVTDPFATTRTTRKMGLGIPLLRLSAEQTGGNVSIESTEGVGTTVRAVFHTDHIDCPPVGDMGSTVSLLVQGSAQMELRYTRRTPRGELRAQLGPDVPLSEPEVALWIRDYVREQEREICEN